MFPYENISLFHLICRAYIKQIFWKSKKKQTNKGRQRTPAYSDGVVSFHSKAVKTFLTNKNFSQELTRTQCFELTNFLSILNITSLYSPRTRKYKCYIIYTYPYSFNKINKFAHFFFKLYELWCVESEVTLSPIAHVRMLDWWRWRDIVGIVTTQATTQICSRIWTNKLLK